MLCLSLPPLQLLGLKGREMYLEPQVGAAYEELFHTALEVSSLMFGPDLLVCT